MNILIAGDFCPQGKAAVCCEQFDHEFISQYSTIVNSEIDYSILNFECPIVMGDERPILKSGPNLSCSKSGLAAVKRIGFDCVTLANNHFRDYGDKGVSNTLDVCREVGLDYVGGGLNAKDASQILYKDIAGEALAVINMCEHEFSTASSNHGGGNSLDPIALYNRIEEALKRANRIVVIIHGGIEHYNLPTPRMKKLYRWLIDLGADAVVNHHQHCYSGFEIYKGKPIFYGLGNFCFERQDAGTSWNDGYAVELSFTENISFKLLPYAQCEENSFFRIKDSKAIESTLLLLNHIIENDELLENSFKEYVKKREKELMTQLIPFENRWIAALYRRNFLGSWFSKRRIRRIKNLICCESHLDVYQQLFNEKYKSQINEIV